MKYETGNAHAESKAATVGHMHSRRRRKATSSNAFAAVYLVMSAGRVLGSLDSVHGPRVHREPDEITGLQRQLQEAALMGDTKLLNITNLITAGADPNGYDEYHMTPLHWAVIKGQRLAVELLLTRGAHTDVRDSSNRTPLHFVGIYGKTILSGNQTVLSSAFSCCLLVCASYHDYSMPWAGWGTEFPSILTALYFAGANFNAADQSQNTPLHLAAAEDQVDTVKELIKYGAKLDMANLWQQRTPLGMATQVA